MFAIPVTLIETVEDLEVHTLDDISNVVGCRVIESLTGADRGATGSVRRVSRRLVGDPCTVGDDAYDPTEFIDDDDEF